MEIEHVSLAISTGTLFVLIYLVWYLQRLQAQIHELRKRNAQAQPQQDKAELPAWGRNVHLDKPPGTRISEIEERKTH
jgi:hypothetical protein